MKEHRADARIAVIDPLRGLAALAVACMHIVHEMGFVPMDTRLFSSAPIGRAGVQVFFVISGFVIPYALQKSGYRVRDFGRFLLKRLVRLDPPYIAAIALAVLIAAYGTWMKQDAFPYSPPQLLVHLGYLNVFFRYHWVNPVFWTLGVEVQYYIAVGLMFPLIMRRSVFWLVVAPACQLLAATSTQQLYIFPHLSFFLLGIAAFHYRQGLLDRKLFAFAVFMISLHTFFISVTAAIACILAAIAMAFFSFAPRPLVALGAISYSLYLLHWPVGSLVGNFVRHSVPGTPPLVVVLVSLAGCLAASWGLYRLVELPSQRWSKRIHYREAPRLGEVGLGDPIPGAAIA
ncbi:MAG: acyltransferase [Gemmatimonadales bacterium]